MDVSLVYLPLNIENNVNEQLKNFTMNFIMFSANIEENNSDNFLQRILNLLKSDTFNILEFNKLLNDLEAESGMPKPVVQNPAVSEQKYAFAGFTDSGTAETKYSRTGYSQNFRAKATDAKRAR